jgi:GxxExxY protein
MSYSPIPDELEKIGKIIVQCSFEVHKNLGPGLLERIYEICLKHELTKRGLKVETQVAIPIIYDTITFEEGLRLDLLVEDEIIYEIKAVDIVNPIWESQVLSYLKLSKKRLGYVINFNVKNMGNGIKRYVL